MANITFTEGSGLQDSTFGKSQEPIKMFLEKRGEAFEQASMLPELFNISPSNHWGEKFTTMTAMRASSRSARTATIPWMVCRKASASSWST